MKGKFITFEGCEGVGKSRQVRELAEYLRQKNVDFLVTREPGGNAISEKIRALILSPENGKMSDECEALLYAASREQYLKEVVLPALAAGKTVISDRFVHSSFAYQGYARGLGFDYVAAINRTAMTDCMPDCTIFLNLSSREAFLRKGGADKDDRVELAGAEFHDRVYQGYLELLKKFPDQMVAVECRGAVKDTAKNIVTVLKERKLIP